MIDSTYIKNILLPHCAQYDKFISEPSFVLEYAQKALLDWEEYNIDTKFANDIISEGGKSGYIKFKQLADNNNSSAKEIQSKVFTLVAYCDSNAKDKKKYNIYSDKRVIAQAGIRQNAWLIQLLKYKNDSTSVTDAIQNVIQYIKSPKNRFPIISETHRKLIYNYIFQTEYDKSLFDQELLSFFQSLNLCSFVNKDNQTYVYTRILYDILKGEWQVPITIQGVFVRDNTDWKEEFLDGMVSNDCGIVWWSKNTVDYGKVYPVLRKQIDAGNTFDYYIAESGLVRYRANIVDFSTANDYNKKRDKWKKGNPLWFSYNFSDYNDGKQNAKIAFLVDSFERLNNPIDINNFITYNNASLPIHNNMVAFTKIITNSNKNMSNIISDIAALVRQKKNIILQGAPGIGKTYNTAAAALRVLGINDIDFSNHNEVMKQYQQFVDEKRIFFTTFHQSLDYEDFIEGLKPKANNGAITYDVENGIFKKICIECPESDFEEQYKLLQIHINSLPNKSLNMQTEKENNPFSISVNENGNLMVSSGVKLESGVPASSITKGKLRDAIETDPNICYITQIRKLMDTLLPDRILIIDEINRGNVSKIFGELITLLEADKRRNGHHPITVTLPYSKTEFSVPSNLYIIGTMNTTDRSVGHIDYAVRRRFAFYTLQANTDAINSYYDNNKHENGTREIALNLFAAIKTFVTEHKSDDFNIEDLMVGHSYFMAETKEELRMKLKYEIIPLISEYEKDGIISLNNEQRKSLGTEWMKQIM
ncbi:MAG: AAA family ATPase [Odoribacter sp.]